MKAPKLLYLGFAFPPGGQALHPDVNPGGHAFETQLVTALRTHFEIKSVGLLPVKLPTLTKGDPSSGVNHDLLLLEKPPELFHRLRSLAQLKAQYRAWRNAGWQPAAVLVYNLSPVYNQFLLWLQRQAARPKLVLLLLDSPNLGQRLPWRKQLRRRFKPMSVPDSEMVERFDACIGLSRTVQKYFAPRQIPFLWMPGGCAPARALRRQSSQRGQGNAGIRFGYFGALASHSGVEQLVEAFLAVDRPTTLEICGYGKLGEYLAQRARQDTRLKYHGLLPEPSDCLRFGQSCDVLVNPRPLSHGNENNFPSKIFEYALCGRAILTTGFSGVKEVLGPRGFYVDEANLSVSLTQQLGDLSRMPAADLQQRGIELQQRVVSEFSWAKQGARVGEFVREACGLKTTGGEP